MCRRVKENHASRGKPTNPHSCCNPCSRQAIVRARRFLGTVHNSRQPRSHSASLFFVLAPATVVLRLISSSSARTSASMSPSMVFTRRVWPSSSSSSSRSPSGVDGTTTVFRMTFLAAPGRPARTSHRGVSGMNSRRRTPCTTAGTAPRPTIQRQPFASAPSPATPEAAEGGSESAQPTR